MNKYLLTFDSVVDDKSPLPPQATTEEEDDKLFEADAWVTGPVNVDYGTNLRYVPLRLSISTED